jgi:predicted metal-binding protein
MITLTEDINIGIIICDRYRTCAGGKCLKAMRNRAGAFSRYENKNLNLVGYTTCNGCPGGNIEYSGEEMVRNGATVIHLATGLLVGYPPCPYIDTFKPIIENRFQVEVVLGTHPIPEKYIEQHAKLGTYSDPSWETRLSAVMSDMETRLEYN